MAQIKLTDFVLLASEFRVWPRGLSQTEDGSDEVDYPTDDVAQISASVTRNTATEAADVEGPEEWILYVHLTIDDETFPHFLLHLSVGARFEIDEMEHDPERAQSTLVWLCYPYIRELVASVSGRSPLPSYYLPALTMMPDPEALQRNAEEVNGE